MLRDGRTCVCCVCVCDVVWCGGGAHATHARCARHSVSEHRYGRTIWYGARPAHKRLCAAHNMRVRAHDGVCNIRRAELLYDGRVVYYYILYTLCVRSLMPYVRQSTCCACLLSTSTRVVCASILATRRATSGRTVRTRTRTRPQDGGK